MIRPFQTAQVNDFGFLFTVPTTLALPGMSSEALGGGGGGAGK